MNNNSSTARKQPADHSSVQSQQFARKLNGSISFMRILIICTSLFALALIGIVLYAIRSSHPNLVDSSFLAGKAIAFLVVVYFVANWLRIYFQGKIDESNASRYGHNRF